MSKHFFLLLGCLVAAIFGATAQVNTSPACIRKTLSVTVFVVLDQNKNPGVTPADISNAISLLNAKFVPICLSFKLCDTKYITNYNYEIFSKAKQEDEISKAYYVKNTINIYLVGGFIDGPLPNGIEFGYANSAGQKDMIFVVKGGLQGNANNVSALIHQMGHYLGLYDTHETQFGKELVDGSNCLTAGDKICDTDADPYFLYSNTGPCQVNVTVRDSKGKLYTPPLANIMSGNGLCRCNFTTMQYNKMANECLTNRSYLW